MEVITVQIKNHSQTHTHSGQNATCSHINKAVKATISFNMSTCLSICSENTASTGWIVVQSDTVLGNESLVQVRQKQQALYIQTYINV